MSETYGDRREALAAALDKSDPGDTITVCRRENGKCGEEICDWCAVITVTFGMTVDDLIEAAKEYRA